METPSIKVDLSQATWIKCEKESMIFEKKLIFKRLSPILSPSGREELIPIETLFCTTCGKIPKFFYEKIPDIPDNLKSDCSF
jgi:hypothetical protein